MFKNSFCSKAAGRRLCCFVQENITQPPHAPLPTLTTDAVLAELNEVSICSLTHKKKIHDSESMKRMQCVDNLQQRISINMNEREMIEAAYADKTLLENEAVRQAVLKAIDQLDKGHLRIAEKKNGEWHVNAWLKQAILLYFGIAKMDFSDIGPIAWHDKIPLKKNLESSGIRLVPPGAIRYGAFVEKGAIVMPGYVNIGAWVGSGTMVDTWATVGSCAQIGRNVHLAGGVGIGGVLEPPGASPVIIEDGCFIGSRCIVVEGALVEEEAVLGANTVITASTPIIDVTGEKEIIYKGRVPARSVVIPGVREKKFPAGTYGLPCALIIGKRKESTDKKTSLNQALRDYSVQV